MKCLYNDDFERIIQIKRHLCDYIFVDEEIYYNLLEIDSYTWFKEDKKVFIRFKNGRMFDVYFDDINVLKLIKEVR